MSIYSCHFPYFWKIRRIYLKKYWYAALILNWCKPFINKKTFSLRVILPPNDFILKKNSNVSRLFNYLLSLDDRDYNHAGPFYLLNSLSLLFKYFCNTITIFIRLDVYHILLKSFCSSDGTLKGNPIVKDNNSVGLQ